MSRPSFNFYPDNYMNDAGVRRCSKGTRGIWVDLLCLMNQGVPYGYLAGPNGDHDPKFLSKWCGEPLSSMKAALKELELHGVFSRTELGTIYSRRMVRDEYNRLVRGAGGCKSAGNPKMSTEYNSEGFVYLIRRESDSATKIGISQDPRHRLGQLQSTSPDDRLSIIESFSVDNMGLREAELHHRFSSVRIRGDWFRLDSTQIADVTAGMDKWKPPQQSSRKVYLPPGRGIGKEEDLKSKTENQILLARFQDLIATWQAPDLSGRVFPCKDVDLGFQVWESLVESGKITAATIPVIMAGLARYRASIQWRNPRYVTSVPGFLGWSTDGRPSAPKWNDTPAPAPQESEY